MKKVVFILIIAVISVTKASAWGKRGHGIVADIAMRMLDENTRVKVEKYIGDMTPGQAGNWMDDVRSDHRYDYMKPWHYVNVDQGKSYEHTKEQNVISQLERVAEELKDMKKMSDDDIRIDILVAFHLVGDMHQPLHVGYGVDKGGNDIKVKYKGNMTNLHRVWDTEIIETANITLADCLKLMKSFSKEDIAMLTAVNPESWMRQPRSKLNAVYSFKDNTIDDEYVARNRKIIEEELLLGGLRLAAFLKATVGSQG